MYSFTFFSFIGNRVERDKLWLSEEIFTIIFVILGRMVYCQVICLVRVLLGGGGKEIRPGVVCFLYICVFGTCNPQGKDCVQYFSLNVSCGSFFCVCWNYVYLKNNNHARTSCDNLTSFRERIKLWKRKKISFFNQMSKQVHSSSVRVVRIFFFIEKPVQQKTISCDAIYFFLSLQ